MSVRTSDRRLLRKIDQNSSPWANLEESEAGRTDDRFFIRVDGDRAGAIVSCFDLGRAVGPSRRVERFSASSSSSLLTVAVTSTVAPAVGLVCARGRRAACARGGTNDRASGGDSLSLAYRSS